MKSENILISVVIPTYNRVNLLRKSIDSVFKQSYKNIEIVVIDDASTESNQQVIDSYHSDKLTYFKFKENQGGNSCRNKGVDISKGEYVAFLDDDDIWNSEKLKLQIDFMVKNRVKLSYTGVNIIIQNERGENINSRYSYHKPKYQKLTKSIMRSNFIGPTSTVMIKKDCFIELNGFDTTLSAMQDYEFYIKCAFFNLKISGINIALVDYFIYLGNNSVGRDVGKHIVAKDRMLKKYKQFKYYKLLYIHIHLIIIKKLVKAQKYKLDKLVFIFLKTLKFN
jgi:glycosyltransferase involved in cell wall biosynthesis